MAGKMTKRQKTWVYAPSKAKKPQVPETFKAQVQQKAAELVEAVLKPRYIVPPPEGMQFNYIVDIYTRWYRNYFYFCSKYACPGPNAIAPSFEDNFARLEYTGDDRFNLAYKRYTEEWIELFQDQTLDECLQLIQEGGWFTP